MLFDRQWFELKCQLSQRAKLSLSSDQHPAQIITGNILDDSSTSMEHPPISVAGFDPDYVISQRPESVLSRPTHIKRDQIADGHGVVSGINRKLLILLLQHIAQVSDRQRGTGRDRHIACRIIDDVTGNFGRACWVVRHSKISGLCANRELI